MGKKLTMGELLEKKLGDKIRLQESGNKPDLILGAFWMQSEIFKCTEKTEERIFFEMIDKSPCPSHRTMGLFILGEGNFYIVPEQEANFKDKYDMFSKSGTKCNIYEVD